MNEEQMQAARKTALASSYINHPTAAYKVMRQLAEYTMMLLTALEAEREERLKCSEFLQATAATLFAERRKGG